MLGTSYSRWLVCATVAVLTCHLSCRIKSVTDANGSPSADEFVEITTSLGVPMILLPNGSFTMGTNDGEPEERPAHRVAVMGFAIDKYEVTQAQFAKLELPDPSHFKDPDRPVEQLRWSDAAAYCNLRSIEEDLEVCYDELNFECNFDATGYRLPTEAEWEYAARAGSVAGYSFGDSTEQIGGYVCYSGNSRKKTDLVGKKKSNAWGIHDMQGNVLEWCQDVFDPEYYGVSPTNDPRGPAAGPKRVLRGGSWNAGAVACRVSTRFADVPGITDACFARDTYGFRCVRKLSPSETSQLARLQVTGESKLPSID